MMGSPVCKHIRSQPNILKQQTPANANQNCWRFHWSSLPFALMIPLKNEFSHWRKPGGQRTGTYWMLNQSEGSYSHSTISNKRNVQISIPSWRAVHNLGLVISLGLNNTRHKIL
jgi:hypothetical protein